MNKKAQVWKYILGGIIALVALAVIFYIIAKQSTQMSGILDKLRDIL
jgi:hypothetical protein